MTKPNDGVFLTMGSERLNKLVAVDTAPNASADKGAGSSKYAEPVATQITALINKLKEISAERYAKEIQTYCDWLGVQNKLKQMNEAEAKKCKDDIDTAQRATLEHLKNDIIGLSANITNELFDKYNEKSAEALKQYAEVRRICELVRKNLGCEPKLEPSAGLKHSPATPRETGVKITPNLSPILLIEGMAGAGKSTLMLQMAIENRNAWRVFFYSLEEPLEELKKSAEDFGFHEDKSIDDIFLDLEKILLPEQDAKFQKVAMCSLTPLSGEESKAGAEGKHAASPAPTSFERRLSQLEHMLKRVKDPKGGDGRRAVFFLDSLNALSINPLSREQIYRLFSAFRNANVPLVVSCESHDEDNSIAEAARFLSDIALRMFADPEDGNSHLRLEICKSRLGQQAHGKHLYKVLHNTYATQIGEKMGGIVVYPAIRWELSRLQQSINDKPNNVEAPEDPDDYEVAAENQKENLVLAIKEKTIKPGASITVVGPSGTNKLALAANLAIGLKHAKAPKKTGKALIISFGVQEEVKLEKIAWCEERRTEFINGLTLDKALKYLKENRAQAHTQLQGYIKNLFKIPTGADITPDLTSSNTVKTFMISATNHTNPTKATLESFLKERSADLLTACFTLIDFDTKLPPKEASKKKWWWLQGLYADVLTFQISNLSAEECLFAIKQRLAENYSNSKKSKEERYASVLINDTAQIHACFPRLYNEKLLLPTLMQMFERYKLVTVWVGVEGLNRARTEIDAAILARADYRISLSHYPSLELFQQWQFLRQLTKLKDDNCALALKEHGTGTATEKFLFDKQFVSMMVDCVVGTTHYERKPSWISVTKDSDDTPKTLCITEAPLPSHTLAGRRRAGQKQSGAPQNLIKGSRPKNSAGRRKP